MELLCSTDVSRYGNDCYINESVGVMYFCNSYFVVIMEKITGWSADDDVKICVHASAPSKEEAFKVYEEYIEYLK